MEWCRLQSVMGAEQFRIKTVSNSLQYVVLIWLNESERVGFSVANIIGCVMGRQRYWTE